MGPTRSSFTESNTLKLKFQYKLFPDKVYKELTEVIAWKTQKYGHSRLDGCGDRPGFSIELIIDHSKTV